MPRIHTLCISCGAITPRSPCAECRRMRRRQYGSAWQVARLRVLERDGYVCRYCGGPANEVDHVAPLSRGGTIDERNLVAACKRCNSGKRDR